MTILRFYILNFLYILSVTFLLKTFFCIYNLESITPIEFKECVYALIWGMRFDLAIASMFSLIAYFLVLLIKVKRNKIGVLFLTTSIAFISFLQLADTAYFSESGRHLTHEFTNGLSEPKAIAFLAMTQYKNLTVLCFVLTLISFLLSNSYLKNKYIYSQRKKEFIHATIITFFSIFLIRGGFRSIPMSYVDAYGIGDPKLGTITLNGSYGVIRSYFQKHNKLERNQLVSIEKEELKKNFKLLYKDKPKTNYPLLDKTYQYNVIFILLESWSASRIASYGYKRSTTPFFDHIRKKSLSTLELIAGGHRTPEGVFTTFCSAQNPLGGSIANSSLQDFKYNCLPQIFRNKGWSSAFFQGTHKNTAGVGSLAQKLGFAKSYGKEEMPTPKVPHNKWGAHDDDLYDFVETKIQDMKQPFFLGINTTSTHDNVLPKGFSPKFKPLTKSNIRDNLLLYSDNALKRFMTRLLENTTIQPTLFVLIADHTSGKQTSNFNHYRIPFLIYNNKNPIEKKYDIIASQRDIAPTLLDLFSWKTPNSFSGKSIIRDYKYRFADYYHGGILGWVTKNRLIEISAANGKLLSCFNYKTWNLNKSRCNQHDFIENKKALSFTRHSQELLFSGKLNIFKTFITEKL